MNKGLKADYNVISYLKTMDVFKRKNNMIIEDGYNTIESFLLKEGRIFKPQPLPSKYRKMPKKNCFGNAFNLVMDNSDLIYVEGYADCKIGIPVQHAWAVDQEGNVIDPTWDDGLEYFGVPFDRKYIISVILDNNYYGVIDNYSSHWPLITGKHKKSKWSERSLSCSVS